MEQIVPQVVHGALDYEELERLGFFPEEILDFSVNTNPYGPSPLIRQVLAQAAIDRYPDRECLELRRTLLAYEYGDTPIALDSILCGNGTAELIWAIARTLLQPRSKAAILGPTFGEYAIASRATGAQVVEYRTRAETQFHLDPAELIAWLQAEQPTLLWLCNPNNPTGIWLNQQAMFQIADACTDIGTALIVDEAYWHFLTPRESFSAITLLDTRRATGHHRRDSGLPLSVPTPLSAVRSPQPEESAVRKSLPWSVPLYTCPVPTTAPLIVLRSLTKTHALAGLRLGYAVASAPVITRIRQQLPSWSVNSFAQTAGIAALADRAHRNRTLAKLAVQRYEFFHALCNLNLPVIPSRTHFCLIDVGDAHRVRQQLLNRRLLVRSCTSFGLPTYIRVATRQRDDWQQLVSALEEVVCH
jgi:histidinol-phosphate aminotransferase